MIKTIIAVGGGEMGRTETFPDGHVETYPIETTKIDKAIIQASGKQHPKILFIGTASMDSPDYFNMVKAQYKDRLKCADVEPLNLVNCTLSYDQIEEKVFASDIIYIGGGDTTTMLKIWREYGLDKILYRAYEKGIILSGLSAGAICWFEYYDNMDDIENIEQLDLVKGLGFIKGFAVPHYEDLTDNEKKRINDKLKEKNIRGWFLDNCTALIFQNDNVKAVLCQPNKTVGQIP